MLLPPTLKARRQKVLKEIEAEGLEYMVGVRLRRLKNAREVAPNLKVKEVIHGGKRYIVCFNPREEEAGRAEGSGSQDSI
jgi:hypothetical protein